MKAQPERKWNLTKAGILTGIGLALAGLAIALPTPTQSPARPGSTAASDAQVEDRAPFIDDFLDAPEIAPVSRDPSLAGLSVAPDADPGGYDVETH